MAKGKSKKKATSKTNSTVNQVKKSQSASWLTNKSLHCLVIFALSCLLYANTITHYYTQDDAIVIYDNEFTTQGLSGIPSIFKYDTFRGFFKTEGKDKLVSGGRYRPLTLVMFAMEVQLFAPKKKNAQGQVQLDKNGNTVFDPYQNGQPNTVKKVGHIVNILLYGATCVLLYILLLKMLQSRYKDEEFIYFIALGTTLLFAAHPLHTEAVANIKGRDEILALLGSLAVAYYCLKAWTKDNMKWSILAGVIFFITLFSKENAITFLGAIPLMFWVFTKAKISDIIKIIAPLLVGLFVFLGIRYSIIGGGIGTPPMELMNNPYVKVQGNQYVPFSSGERLGTIFFTLWKYIQLQIIPHPLTHDYYPRHIDIISMGNWRALLGLFSHLGLLIFALIRLPKKDPLSFGILYYLGTLLIVSNLIFPIGTNMAERLIFMPSVGFCFVLAILFYRLAKMMGKGSKAINLTPALGLVGLFVVLFSLKTITRNPAWKDNFTLFTTDVKVSHNSAKLQNSVGGELIAQSTKETDETKKKAILNQAVGHLQKAIEIHPNYKNAYLLVGNAYNYLKQYNKSVQYYEKALSLDPNYPEAIQNLGIAYRDSKQFDKAVAQFGKLEKMNGNAVVKNENIAYTYEEAGKFYGSQNQHQKALDSFKKAIQYSSDKGKYEYFVGLAYVQLQNVPKAIEFMEKGFNLTDNPENKGYIAASLADLYKSVNPAKAQEYAQKAQEYRK